MSNAANTKNLRNRLGYAALAFALSAGTVGAMVSFATLSSAPALAATAGGSNGGNGGNGGNGSGPAGGGETGDVMNPNIAGAPQTHRRRGTPPNERRNSFDNCNGSRDTINTAKCRYTTPRAVRIVNIHGFANCAIIQQLPNGSFYCARAM